MVTSGIKGFSVRDVPLARVGFTAVVLALALVFAASAARAEGAPGLTPEEVFAAEVREHLQVRPDQEAAFAAYLAQLMPIFVMPAGQPRPGVERVTLFLESAAAAPSDPPIAFAGEVAWTSLADPAMTVAGSVAFPDGPTAAVWIALVAGGSALDFGIRLDGAMGELVTSLFEVSVGGRYLIERTPLAEVGALTAPGTLVARVTGADLAAAAGALRDAEVLSFVVLVPGGSVTLSVALGISAVPILASLLAAAGV